MSVPARAQAERVDELPSPITAPYLLVSGIPVFVDAEGGRWIDPLWLKDLGEHQSYLQDLTLAAPVIYQESPPPGSASMNEITSVAAIKILPLPFNKSHLRGIVNWPVTFHRLWRAARHTRIIHAGVADWPIPTGWAATLVAIARRRFLLINIESAFWRVPSDASLPRRIRATVWELLNRWCVNKATLPLFTHEGYAHEMLKEPARAHVLNASWIDENIILDAKEAIRSWEEKSNDPVLRLLFVGRLVRGKGVPQLLEAARQFADRVQLDVLGFGDLEASVLEASEKSHHVRLLKPIPYDASFFRFLRTYHAVVVPTQTDEQPRIVYDAYSQALPVLATNTTGNLGCVVGGHTGLLSDGKDAGALVRLIRSALDDRDGLRRMGLSAREFALSYTHKQMHLFRWRLLATLINGASALPRRK